MNHSARFSSVVSILLAACGTKGPEAMPDTPDTVLELEVSEPIPEVAAEILEMPAEDGFHRIDEMEPIDAAEAGVGPEMFGDMPSACPGGPDCACETGADCFGGPCMETLEGRRCGRVCSGADECPEGWPCLAYGEGEARFCTDPFVTLCRPCFEDSDCAVTAQDAVHRCIEAGPSGRFCGTVCDDFTPCPQGYDCVKPSSLPDGGSFCLHSGGADCPCTDAFKAGGFRTVCYRENDNGKCFGERTCDTACSARVPLAETCNLLDDDCDGQTDETILSTACELKNDFGTCPGTSACVAGQTVCQGTPASAESCNGLDDDCDGAIDEDFPDTDVDGMADCRDDDIDGDGVVNGLDNCPLLPNSDQADLDLDGTGDACDADRDGDGVLDGADNCPGIPNEDQADENGNGIGDACEADWDGDGTDNADDNCPWVANPVQEDSDQDGIGNACDCDIDGDGLANANPGCPEPDPADNCPYRENADQGDLDRDGLGDACDPDRDGDGDPDETDCAPDDFYIGATRVEICNGLDDNCDGLTDDAGAAGCTPFYYDSDGDGYGTASQKCLCVAMGYFKVLTDGDCDDKNPTVNPDAMEICNGKDDDCDGLTDEEGAEGCQAYLRDQDGDGRGLATDTKCLCGPLAPYTAVEGGDCDDGDSMIGPAAEERCNGKDDDCDGLTDERDAVGCLVFFMDADGDGYGNPTASQCLCDPDTVFTALNGGDCDDANPGVSPQNRETCNGRDDDCDGQVDEENAEGCTTFSRDEDRDGYGRIGDAKCLCQAAVPYDATVKGDCDDSRDAVHPGATETCNGGDDDCDGETDEADAQGCSPFFLDTDGDGFGVSGQARCLCGPSGMYRASASGDCDDGVKTIHPGAPETCNGLDDDCDGQTDEEGAAGCSAYYRDADGDGSGVSGQTKCLCGPTGTWSALAGGDCDDNDRDVSPTAAEKCDFKDNDCDGQVDEADAVGCRVYFPDADGDGYGVLPVRCLCGPFPPWTAERGGDCDDGSKAISPGQAEACNGRDDDCDGLTDEEGALGCRTWYYDGDGDGHGAAGTGRCLCQPFGNLTAQTGDDCDDTNPEVFGGAVETCNGRDDDCDQAMDEADAIGCTPFFRDEDKDGFGLNGQTMCLCAKAFPYTTLVSGDCDDTNPGINPLARERCGNKKDDNCDGNVDEPSCEGCTTFYYDGDNDDWGVESQFLCLGSPMGYYKAMLAGDCNDADSKVNPGAAETCNGKDDDCDGQTDEEGATGCVAYYPDADGDGFGPTGQSKCLCAASGIYKVSKGGDCNDADKAVSPAATEVCNNKDDDCDGQTDEADATGCTKFYRDADGDGFGSTGESQCLCAASGLYRTTKGLDCDDTDANVKPGATEQCNGRDDDCDGVTDPENTTGCRPFFLDQDKDGWGTSSRCLCGPSGSHSASLGGDCLDTDAAVHPGAKELCNGKDDDCDGVIDPENTTGCATYYFDADNDGWGVTGQARCLCGAAGLYRAFRGQDCADGDATVYPGATETCNGKDDDCDGKVDPEGATGCVAWFLDADGDGFGVTGQSRCLCAASGNYRAPKGLDCDDTAAAINPGAAELCNGRDDDCDGQSDESGGTPFSFQDLVGQPRGTLVVSAPITPSGIMGAVTASVTGDGSPELQVNGGKWATSQVLTAGQTLAVRLTSSPEYGGVRKAVVTICGQDSTWTVVTEQDDIPDPFDFVDLMLAARGVVVSSAPVTPKGYQGTVTAFVTGDGNPRIRIAGGAWVTSGPITLGQTIEVQLTSSVENAATSLARVQVGQTFDDWRVTTLPACDTAPHRFQYTGVEQTFPIAMECFTATVKAWGGGGGAGGYRSHGIGGNGGGAGFVRVDGLEVSPGKVFTIKVGGGGKGGGLVQAFGAGGLFGPGGNGGIGYSGGGPAGGGGGGASIVSYDGKAVLTAGGGGGGGGGTQIPGGSGTPGCGDGKGGVHGGPSSVQNGADGIAGGGGGGGGAGLANDIGQGGHGGMCTGGVSTSGSLQQPGNASEAGIYGHGGSGLTGNPGQSGTDGLVILEFSGPVKLDFKDVSLAPRNAVVSSESLIPGGFVGSATATVTGEGDPKIRIGGGDWVTSGTITLGQTLQVRLTSAPGFSTPRTVRVWVGSLFDDWTVTTAATDCDTTPRVFVYTGTDQSYIPPSGCGHLMIQAWGGGGGAGGYRETYPGGNGGGGGFAMVESLEVVPGKTLVIRVGGGGGGGGLGQSVGFGALFGPGGNGGQAYDVHTAAGGGGGGASIVLYGSSIVVMAGGGGGGGGGGSKLAGGAATAGCDDGKGGLHGGPFPAKDGSPGQNGGGGGGGGGAAGSDIGQGGHGGTCQGTVTVNGSGPQPGNPGESQGYGFGGIGIPANPGPSGKNGLVIVVPGY